MAGVNEEERKWVIVGREGEEGEEQEEEVVVVVGESGEIEEVTPEGKKARCWECGHRYCNGDRREGRRQRQRPKGREEEEDDEGASQDVDDQDRDRRDYHSCSRLNNGRNDDDNEEREETGNGTNNIVDDEDDDDAPRNACDLGLRYLCWICWSCETRNRYEANQPWDSLRCSHCRYFRNGACGWTWKPEVLENDWGYEDGPVDGAYDVDEEDGEEEKDERRWRRVGASHWVKMNIVRKVSDSGGGEGRGGDGREDVDMS